MKLTKIEAWTLDLGHNSYTFVQDGSEWNGLLRLRHAEGSGFLIVMRDPESFANAIGALFGEKLHANIIAGTPDLIHKIKSFTPPQGEIRPVIPPTPDPGR
jgi:hypothetical protein